MNKHLFKYGIDFLIENKGMKQMYKDMKQLHKELEVVLKNSEKLKKKFKYK